MQMVLMLNLVTFSLARICKACVLFVDEEAKAAPNAYVLKNVVWSALFHLFTIRGHTHTHSKN